MFKSATIEQEKTVKNTNMEKKGSRLPDTQCSMCGKAFEEVGGKRIVAQKHRAVFLSKEYRGGEDADFPFRSFDVGEGEEQYLVVQGEKEKWPPEAIERARQAFKEGYRPWFCQICAEYKCSECGAPINYPMGADVLYENGCSTHIAIHPFDPGCSNPACRRYKNFPEQQNKNT